MWTGIEWLDALKPGDEVAYRDIHGMPSIVRVTERTLKGWIKAGGKTFYATGSEIESGFGSLEELTDGLKRRIAERG